jgi:hypothetical protein
MTPPVVSPERGAVAPDVLPFWGADQEKPPPLAVVVYYTTVSSFLCSDS